MLIASQNCEYFTHLLCPVQKFTVPRSIQILLSLELDFTMTFNKVQGAQHASRNLAHLLIVPVSHIYYAQHKTLLCLVQTLLPLVLNFTMILR